MSHTRILLCFGLVISMFAQDSSTGAPPSLFPQSPLSFKSIRFSGLIDTYADYNPDHPASGFNALRNFDVRSNSFQLNMARIMIESDPAPVGFKLDLGFGRAMDYLNFQDKANGFNAMRDIPQAYVSFKPKNGKGLQLDFGKFYTSAGAEPTETHLNWNYTRSLLFTNGPYYHFGLRSAMPLNKYLTVGFQLVNGWNNVRDNNGGKTMGFTTALTVGKMTLTENYYTGPEQNNTNKGWRNFSDTVLLYTFNTKSSAYLNFDYGTQRFAASRGSNDWLGFAAAYRYQISKKFAFSPRVEYYYDKDGFITGTAQKIKAVTLTGEYKLSDLFFSRLEYCSDFSNQPFFERGTLPNSYTRQPSFLIGLVALLGVKR
ncbi:MAG: porin [Acidobacteriota bacterium]